MQKRRVTGNKRDNSVRRRKVDRKLDEIVISLKEELVRSISDSIKIKSVQDTPVDGGPFGKGVRDSLDQTIKLAQKLGFEARNADGYVGIVDYGLGETFGVLGHLDVVPEGEGWEVPPYSGLVKDGEIWGRGTQDDKGPMIAALYALKAIKDYVKKPSKRIRLIFGTNEETGWECMKYYVKHEEIPDFSVTPDADFPVIFAEKGIVNYGISAPAISGEKGLVIENLTAGEAPNMVASSAKVVLRGADDEILEKIRSFSPKNNTKLEINKSDRRVEISITGISAHGSTPNKGQSALAALVDLLAELPLEDSEMKRLLSTIRNKIGYEFYGESLGISGRDSMSGELTLNMGTLRLQAGVLKLVINIRYPVFFNEAMIRSQIEEAFNGFRVETYHHQKPLYVSPDSELVKMCREVYKEVTGHDEEPIAIGGGTYARAVPNAVAFGALLPGNVELAHQPNERISIEDVLLVARIYAQLFLRFLQT